jgi:hypothetical protein
VEEREGKRPKWDQKVERQIDLLVRKLPGKDRGREGVGFSGWDKLSPRNQS